MAGTSLLATICAERLTKFLLNYPRSQLRGSLVTKMRRRITPVDVMRETVKGCKPTVYVNPVERKYSLWQPVESRLQAPKIRPLEHILGYRVAAQTRSLIPKPHRSQLAAVASSPAPSPSPSAPATRPMLQSFVGPDRNNLFHYVF